ncbi:MAG: hypothetical protein JXM70_26185 [Pirellulales bacterium]|nr:hypothetical protein [Pirellulales bacterium]
MEDRISEIRQRYDSADNPIQETVAQADRLAASIESAVRRKTAGGVRNLHVKVNRSGIVLEGRCDTFYCKQLAQHAAMNVSANPLSNEIKVS